MEPPLPPDVVRAAYAELVVTDLDAARAFYVDLLGFVVSADTGDALYLRGYDELTHQNLILRAGGQAAAARLAYRVRAEADLDRARWFWVELLGFAVTRADDGALYLRGYDELTHHNLILREGREPAAASGPARRIRLWWMSTSYPRRYSAVSDSALTAKPSRST